MNRLAGMLSCVSLVACAATPKSTDARTTTRPFTASSFRSSYGVQGTFEGSIALGDRWVYVTIPTGGVKTYQLDRQDFWDLRLRAGLVSCKGRNYQVMSEGRAARVAPLLGLSPDFAYLDTTVRTLKDTLRLDVGVPAGTDMAHSWFALIFEWPVQGAMAIYELHTSVPVLTGSAPWTGREAENPALRCR